jgi:lipopolysaccharide/colanic/teichoic acid biosynthesis glycosyltransferase
VQPSFYERAGKRAFDFVVSLVLLVVISPVILVAAAMVVFNSGLPAFYGATRVGKDGRLFRMWKLRTMVRDADAMIEFWKRKGTEEGLVYFQSYKLRNDPRVTRIGRILRKTSVDELPQLFNVLRGEMSLVGPRPIVESELAKYGPRQEEFLSMRPGVTGLWQVNGRNDIDYPERADVELAYAERTSALGDISLLAQTIPVLLKLNGR